MKIRIWCAENRSIKPKIRWKAKELPDVWQGQHQALEVLQALITRDFTTKLLQKPRKIKVFRGFLISQPADMLCPDWVKREPVLPYF